MREVKFRGKVDGVWWYFTANDGNEGEWSQFWGLVDRKTVGECTGLLDIKGTEIYEGDIVSWEFAGTKFIRTVRWDDNEAMFLPNDMKGEVQVLGNIYDTPELIQREVS